MWKNELLLIRKLVDVVQHRPVFVANLVSLRLAEIPLGVASVVQVP